MTTTMMTTMTISNVKPTGNRRFFVAFVHRHCKAGCLRSNAHRQKQKRENENLVRFLSFFTSRLRLARVYRVRPSGFPYNFRLRPFWNVSPPTSRLFWWAQALCLKNLYSLSLLRFFIEFLQFFVPQAFVFALFLF
jgi:hypothetical protein